MFLLSSDYWWFGPDKFSPVVQTLHNSYGLLTKCEVKKKERGQYPAHLTEQAKSIKDLLYGFREIFLRGTAGSPERARQLHLARSGSQSQHRILFISPAHGALAV